MVMIVRDTHGPHKQALLAGDFCPAGCAGAHKYWVGAVVDANGDGVMEVFVAWGGVEATGTSVCEVRGGHLARVIESGWNLQG